MPRLDPTKDYTMLRAIDILTGGDPEAIRICLDIGKRAGVMDPYVQDAWIYVLQFDDLGIYDSEINRFANEFCEGKLINLLAALKAVECGNLEAHILLDRFNERGSFDFAACIVDLQEKFKVFGLESSLDNTGDAITKREVSGGMPDSGRSGTGRVGDTGTGCVMGGSD